VLSLKKAAASVPPMLVEETAGLPAVYHAMPIAPQLPPASNTGGSFSRTFTIPGAISARLAARAKAYPIPWRAVDRIATWLDPNRLIGYIFIANPKDSLLAQITLTVDGAPVEVKQSYNSRGLNHSRSRAVFWATTSMRPNWPPTSRTSLR
jgi:hypothetical protein